MSSILSAISGQFSKSLILSALFPVTAFALLTLLALAPLLPPDLPALAPLEALDPQWKIALFTLLVVVLAGLLYNLNIPLLRLYEGYPWEDSWIGGWRKAHHAARLAAALARVAGMRTLARSLPEEDPRGDSIAREWTRNLLLVNSAFPAKPSLVLPTRLGNVIRCFEYYSDRQYGIDSITLWPRLIAKIDKDYAAAIDDAKASFDFMLNSSALGALAALALLVAGLTRLTPFASWPSGTRWGFEVVAFLILAHLFYRGAIARASAWGSLVKGAFDLYRSALLDQLGYRQPIASMQEERVVWDRISRQMLFGDRYAVGPRIDFAYVPSPAPGAVARGVPYDVPLPTVRGVGPAGNDGTVAVTVRVRNADRARPPRQASDIELSDALADGFDYVWGSAQMEPALANPDALVLGTAPLRFAVGALAPGEQKTVRYGIVQRQKR